MQKDLLWPRGPEYQTRQRSLRSSRWESRTIHGVWESHAQGEGKQIFPLSVMKEEHKVQDPNILLTMLSNNAIAKGKLESRILGNG
jgi:hypothetical protein